MDNDQDDQEIVWDSITFNHQHSIVVTNVDPGTKSPGFLHYLLAVWPWVSYSTFVCFFICEVWMLMMLFKLIYLSLDHCT